MKGEPIFIKYYKRLKNKEEKVILRKHFKWPSEH